MYFLCREDVTDTSVWGDWDGGGDEPPRQSSQQVWGASPSPPQSPASRLPIRAVLESESPKPMGGLRGKGAPTHSVPGGGLR